MNLIEALRQADGAGENMKAAIISNFLEADDFFSRAEFHGFGGSFSFGWNEEKTLPGAGTRSLNENYTASNGETDPRQEGLKIYGGMIDVDAVQKKQLGDEIVLKKQEKQIKAIRLKMLNDFVNGSSATDVEQFDGLKTQLPTTTAGRIDRGYIVNNGGAALSRKKLDELVYNTDDSTNPVLLMDKSVPFLINQYGESLVTFDKNEFGAPVARYGDVPIVTFDRNNVQSKILGFTEASSTSSIFRLNLNVDEVVMLEGEGGILVHDAEKAGSKFNYQIDWLLSLAIQGQYNAGRLYNFTALTMVA